VARSGAVSTRLYMISSAKFPENESGPPVLPRNTFCVPPVTSVIEWVPDPLAVPLRWNA
jgi:hypothetical protein